MDKLQKGLIACIDLLDVAKNRVREVLQSDEAKAFARKIRSEAGKDKVRLERVVRNKALRVIGQCELGLAKAKSMLVKEQAESKKRKK